MVSYLMPAFVAFLITTWFVRREWKTWTSSNCGQDTQDVAGVEWTSWQCTPQRSRNQTRPKVLELVGLLQPPTWISWRLYMPKSRRRCDFWLHLEESQIRYLSRAFLSAILSGQWARWDFSLFSKAKWMKGRSVKCIALTSHIIFKLFKSSDIHKMPCIIISELDMVFEK